MYLQLFFQCTSMIEVLLGVGLSAHKWSAHKWSGPQRWSAPAVMVSHPEMVSPAEMVSRAEIVSPAATVSHMRMRLRFKVDLIGLRSEVKGEGQPFCT